MWPDNVAPALADSSIVTAYCKQRLCYVTLCGAECGKGVFCHPEGFARCAWFYGA
jgi:hypothetical protein